MSRPAPVPFDPDQHGRVVLPPEPEPVMLSAVMTQMAGEVAAPPVREEGPGTARPLDNREKWQLTALARRTYEHLKNAGEIPAGVTEEAFRQAESVKACQRRISQATVGDRMLIQAHFLKLKGNVAQAARAAVKATHTARDIALWHLSQDLKAGSKSEAYAEGIARRFYKRSLIELSTKEIWCVVKTIRNTNNAAAGKGQANQRYKKARANRAAAKQNKSL